MNYKVLYRKYRPSTFDEIIGQTNIVNILRKSIDQQKTSHAYIFTGIRGTGKTSMAKIFAKAINCTDPIAGDACGKCENCKFINDSPDIVEIDAASNNSVENIREIIENSRLVPSHLKYKTYIIDEVHMLSSGAFNALLKTLEEPTSHVKFILATTEIQKVPITILSRCQRFDFQRINFEDIKKYIIKISKKEKINIDVDAAEEIAYLSDGSVRDALSILDQLSSHNENIDVDVVEKNFGTISDKKIKILIEIIDSKITEDFIKITSDLKKDSVNIVILVTKLLNLYMNKSLISIKNEKNKFNFYKKIIFTLSEKLNDIKNSYDPYLIFELIIVDLMINHNDQEPQIKPTILDKIEVINSDYDNFSTTNETNLLLEVQVNKNELKAPIKTEQPNSPDELKDSAIENNEVSDDEIVKIRLNNCFAEANKEEKVIQTSNWKKFVTNLQEENLTIFSIVENSEVKVASKHIIIIVVEKEQTCELLSKKIFEIESLYNKKIKEKIKLCFISNNRWLIEKDIYIKNKNEKKEYEIIEEPKKNNKKEDKITEKAMELFGEDSIDIR